MEGGDAYYPVSENFVFFEFSQNFPSPIWGEGRERG